MAEDTPLSAVNDVLILPPRTLESTHLQKPMSCTCWMPCLATAFVSDAQALTIDGKFAFLYMNLRALRVGSPVMRRRQESFRPRLFVFGGLFALSERGSSLRLSMDNSLAFAVPLFTLV